MKTPRYIPNFDSTSAMLRATGRFLRGKDFPGLGVGSDLMEPFGAAVNALPKKARETLYIWSGWGEAIPANKLSDVSAEQVSRWMVNQYPRRKYQAIMVGSSNGAAVHLCAALGIPWLPQTFLIPVRQNGIHPDEPEKGMKAAKQAAEPLLAANPELQLHHMHDANQDRLMIQRMMYFRVKRLRLGNTFERFLEENLSPGGTILLIECTARWPTTHVANRHIFQCGALGGAAPEEYMHGSDRVERYLEKYGSHRRRWVPPRPDGDRPEAEWGFAPALRQDVERFARVRGFRVKRIVFKDPEDLSPLVADLYRWRYEERRLPANRLLVESFILLEPWWTLRTGSIPLWMKFSVEPSAEYVEHYLNRSDPFDQIHIMLFSHGVESVGLAPIERWKSILAHARKQGSFIGVDEQRFPRDFAAFIRYHKDFKKIPARYPIPGPLALTELYRFMKESSNTYNVQLIDSQDSNGSEPKPRFSEDVDAVPSTNAR